MLGDNNAWVLLAAIAVAIALIIYLSKWTKK